MIAQVVVRWAVPVFVMISGYLLLDSDKDVSLRKLKGYVLRMLAILVTCGYVYCVIEAVTDRGLSNMLITLLLSAKNLVEGKSWAHMWYVYMLIGLYVLTPILRTFTKDSSQREMAVVLLVLFGLTVVRTTINNFFDVEIEGFVPISSPYIFYYLMGAYIHKYGLTKRLSWAGLAVGLLGIILMELGEKIGITIGSFPDNMFVAAYSIGIFSLAKDIHILDKWADAKIVLSISRLSFGIYLIHPFFLNLLNKGFNIFPGILPTGIGEIAFFLYAFAGAYAITWLGLRIRPFRRLLT